MRPEGVSSGEDLKYVCYGFKKDDGIRSNYHLCADPELVEADHRPNVIAMRRFPCFCASCVSKMMEPIETRYTGPSDTCIYWEIFKNQMASLGTMTGS